MKKMSLKWKIYFVGLVPFICFLSTALIYPIGQNYSSYTEAKALKTKMAVIEAASAVVHETQKERGKSAGYLNGGGSIEDLNEQRAINDRKHEALKSALATSAFTDKYKEDLLFRLSQYKDLRAKVTAKSIPLAQALKSYSEIIARFLDIELYVAQTTPLAQVAAKLQSLRILEDAKESGGKLRANMTGVLAKNSAISDAKFSALVALKAGVDEGLKSSGLALDDKSKEIIESFKGSQQWKTVNSTFKLILQNAERGNFYQDSEEFFTIITGALNILGELVIHQKDLITNTVDTIEDQSRWGLVETSAIASIIFLGLFFFVTIMSGGITKKIRMIIESLKNSSLDVTSSSQEIESTSHELSEASTEQASSLQETVSSIAEISSMVQRNSEAASSSTQTSERSKEEAEQGKRDIDEMIVSIAEIAQSSDEIMTEMKNNNDEITKITTVIAEIGEKTKVINDIVFQTKLLSFNASVEAARAGEHGKGFAVVAEEVGNLAAMSGKAALEISEMLDSSIKQVNDIVTGSKGKIEMLVSKGKEKVDRGTSVANRCGEALERILNNVESVNDMFKEIAIASSEQSTGVNEVTSAMQQLDQVTHQNTSAAQSSASMASQLKASAKHLNTAVDDLIKMVDGNSDSHLYRDQNSGKPSGLGKAKNASVQDLTDYREQQSKQTFEPREQLKVSGSDTAIPSEDDPRFEDL